MDLLEKIVNVPFSMEGADPNKCIWGPTYISCNGRLITVK